MSTCIVQYVVSLDGAEKVSPVFRYLIELWDDRMGICIILKKNVPIQQGSLYLAEDIVQESEYS